MIKIEEESFGSSTQGDVIKFLTHFHDDQSIPQYFPQMNPVYQPAQQQPIYQTSDLIDYIDKTIDIRTTPMIDIQQFVAQNYPLEKNDMRLLTSGILKKKRILKRQRAKNRIQISQQVKLQYNYTKSLVPPMILDLTNDQTEKKKKRNRISAQISRDRKKQYLIDLQQQNKRLNEQTKLIQRENQDLKQKLNDIKTKKNLNIGFQQQKKSEEVYEPKNRFLKLLMFLGIIFLFTTLKETINSNKFTGIAKKPISNDQQNFLIGKVQNLFGGFSDQMNHLGNDLKTQVCKKIQGLKRRNSPMLMSSQMYQGLLFSTSSLEI